MSELRSRSNWRVRERKERGRVHRGPGEMREGRRRMRAGDFQTVEISSLGDGKASAQTQTRRPGHPALREFLFAECHSTLVHRCHPLRIYLPVRNQPLLLQIRPPEPVELHRATHQRDSDESAADASHAHLTSVSLRSLLSERSVAAAL